MMTRGLAAGLPPKSFAEAPGGHGDAGGLLSDVQIEGDRVTAWLARLAQPDVAAHSHAPPLTRLLDACDALADAAGRHLGQPAGVTLEAQGRHPGPSRS
jgi:hypothetical protein